MRFLVVSLKYTASSPDRILRIRYYEYPLGSPKQFDFTLEKPERTFTGGQRLVGPWDNVAILIANSPAHLLLIQRVMYRA